MPLQSTKVCAVLLAGLMLFQCRIVYSCNTGDIRLWNRGADNTREGRVEFCYGGEWNYYYRIVHGSIGATEAQVICRELGYCTRGVVATNQDYQEVRNITGLAITSIYCTGDENRLIYCQGTLNNSLGNYYYDAGVSCVADAPNKPLNASLMVINASSVRISWSAPDMSYCRDIDNYIISCQDLNCTHVSVSQTLPSSSTAATISNSHLFSHCDYKCCVRGRNSAGEGPASCLYSRQPTPPRNVTVSSILNSPVSLMVEWLMSEHINGVLTSYQVTCISLISSQRTESVTTNRTQLLIVTGLNPFTQYQCCVSVSNEIHISSPACGNGTTAQGQPTPPKNVTVSPILNSPISLMVKWLMPEHFNGQFESYQVTCTSLISSQRTEIVTTNSTQLPIETGLNPFTQYQCCVSASNEVHISSPACGNGITAQASPDGPPLNPTTEVLSSTMVTLSWEQPLQDELNGILQWYNITLCQLQPAGTCSGYNTIQEYTTIQFLHPHYIYNWSVSAYTIGPGPYAHAVHFQMLEDRPTGKPQNITHQVITFSSIQLSWIQPPLPDQNGVIIVYRVVVFNADKTTHSNITVKTNTFTAFGLEEITSYRFRVSAMTAVGEGPYQEYGPITTSIGWKFIVGMPTLGVLILLISAAIFALAVCICVTHLKKQRKFEASTNTCSAGSEEAQRYSGRNTLEKFYRGQHRTSKHEFEIDLEQKQSSPVGEENKLKGDNNEQILTVKDRDDIAQQKAEENRIDYKDEREKSEEAMDDNRQTEEPQRAIPKEVSSAPKTKVEDEVNATNHELSTSLTEHKNRAKKEQTTGSKKPADQSIKPVVESSKQKIKKKFRNKVKIVTQIGSDKTEPSCHEISAAQRIKKWLKLNKPQKSVDPPCPSIPLRHYLEDDQFMRKNFEGQPAIPSRSNVAKTEPTIMRKPLLDEEFLRGLDNFAAKLTSRADEVDLGDDDKIYQPLIPPRRYEGSNEVDSDVYQPLTLIRSTENSMETDNVLQNMNDTESMYQPLVKPDQQSIYQPLMAAATSGSADTTGGVAGSAAANNSEGLYQPLTKRDKASEYEPVNLNGFYQPLKKRDRAKAYELVNSNGFHQPLRKKDRAKAYELVNSDSFCQPRAKEHEPVVSDSLYQPLKKRDKVGEYEPVVLQGCSIGSEEPSRTQSS